MREASSVPSSSAPTVRDVAVRAGVSPMTVSRTMSGGLNVRPEVQERVFKAVQELGYWRNHSARNIRLGRPSGLVGIVVTNIGNPYYGEFALGIEGIAEEYGRQIVVGNTGEDPGRERELLTDFAARQIEGVILVPAGNGLELPGSNRLAHVPLVLASRTIDGLAADTVLVDDIEGARSGTQCLLDDGHTRIAFLGDAAGISTTRRRLHGFSTALSIAGIAQEEVLQVPCRDAPTAQSEVARLLNAADPPTAFFSSNNRITVGALRAICEYRNAHPGFPVPALACFDDVELADLLQVPLVVMSHDPKELGEQAARLLFDRLAGSVPAEPRDVRVAVTIHRY
ncbi:LacI family transcriptional regulator [Pseudarthrobacter sp. W1I19]|uniref:LacI family DNA-binding transcriptional regulator n=1 Tax=Pseudarthrobacter sp. W1I19 TaxID=3042288 RepID=UPI0027879176|nr:LacI family DNA-binding transcriptional regulator [Pseudarthrobacter sp. W1I19]MDQ0923887.1 LacI family transcriptional regulator [Pseudarthrobacter sp. W1I19]